MLSNQRWVSLFHTTAPSAVISPEALLPPKICIEKSVSLPGCSRKKPKKWSVSMSFLDFTADSRDKDPGSRLEGAHSFGTSLIVISGSESSPLQHIPIWQTLQDLYTGCVAAMLCPRCNHCLQEHCFHSLDFNTAFLLSCSPEQSWK